MVGPQGQGCLDLEGHLALVGHLAVEGDPGYHFDLDLGWLVELVPLDLQLGGLPVVGCQPDFGLWEWRREVVAGPGFGVVGLVSGHKGAVDQPVCLEYNYDDNF